MPKSSKLNLTRRSFVLGGTAGLAAAAFTLSSCNRKKAGNSENAKGDIFATFASTAPNLSPVANTNPLGRSSLLHISEGLYNVDPITNKTYNGLAALSPNKVNDYTYEVVLRDDATFSDGNSVKPEDVVNSFKLNMQDSVIGPLLSFIKDVSVKDNKTVTFTLNYPFENLIEQRLAIVFIWPVSQSEKDYQINPIGSGPWMLKSFDGNDGGKIEFVRNSYYSGKHEVSGENMTWNILSNNDARVNSLLDKNSFCIESVPDKSNEKITSKGAKIDYVEGFSCAYLMFNTLKAPFNDKKVRQAFHYAINKQNLIDKNLEGHGSASSSLLPSNHPNYHKASLVYDYSEDKAKQLLKEAGQSIINCTLTIDSDWVAILANDIKSDLAKVGINVELDVKPINWADFAENNKILPFDVVLAHGNQSIIGNDADLLMSYWYGNSTWMDGCSCWKKSDPNKWNELNVLAQRAREVVDASVQQTLWEQCFDVISEQCPIYPLLHREIGTGYYDDILVNFKPISNFGLSFLGVSALET